MHGEERTKPSPHIVVLGAGFGGLAFCRAFRGDARITIVDRQNHHLFQPLLYQVAMSGLAATEIAEPVRSVFRRRPEITVHMGEVRGVDLARRLVQLADRQLEYDALVIALGGETSYFGNPRFEASALGLKTLDDALAIRRRILTSFERAESTDDLAERRRLMTIAVVGGGPTGVELAGAMADLCHHVFLRDFRNIDTTRARVVLVEAGDRLLPTFTEAMSRSARRQIEGMGVEVMLGATVADVTADGLVLESGEVIESRNVLWGAGVRANRVTAGLGLELDRAGRIVVGPDLAVPGYPEVFAVGDIAAAFGADGEPVPGLAPAAIQGGRHVARLLAQRLEGDAGGDGAFTYRDRGMMATIGRRHAVAQVRGRGISGALAWLAWAVIHLLFLITFRNKLMVFVSWAFAYASYKQGARIIHGGDGGGAATARPEEAAPRAWPPVVPESPRVGEA